MVTARIHHRAIARNATRTGLARLTSDGRLDAPKVTQYVWDQSYIDTPVLRYQDVNGDGDTTDLGDSVLYYTTDANHNITALINAATGAVVERYAYDAYGKVTIYNGDFSQQRNTSAYSNEILYCGYRQDSETAITAGALLLPANYHVRNREYSTLLSNWTSRDPLGYAAGDMNVYRYVGNGPTTAMDPTGTILKSRCKIDSYLEKYIGFDEPRRKEGYYVYSTASGSKRSPVRAEILTRMIDSRYPYRVAGNSEQGCLGNIEKHVETRVNILRLAESKKYGFGAGDDFTEHFTTPGVDYTTDPFGYFNSINNDQTSIACLWATQLTFFGGIGAWWQNYRVRTLGSTTDVVPGDWGYIYNLANKSNATGHSDARWAPGLEGENIIYVGRDRFWGHISDTQVVQTWQAWFADMRAWTSKNRNIHGKPRMDRKVKFPTVGLEN